MSAPQPPPAPSRSSRKLVLGAVLVAIPLLVVLIPFAVYGGFTVHVSRITFGETTGSLTTTSAQVTVESKTVYEYMFSVKTGGMVRTSETDVSASRGTANVTMRLELTNPSGQTVNLGNVNISGAMGSRNHTIYLGVDEGVRVPGSYKLDIIITASVAPIGGIIQLNLTTTVPVNFTIS